MKRTKMNTTYEFPMIDEIDGQLVLIDPVAAEIITVIEKANCKATLKGQLERVLHFRRRIQELGKSPNEVVITLIKVDDPHGKDLADVLMPNHDWQQYRDRGEIPFARGLATRDGIYNFLKLFDEAAATKLKNLKNEIVVVVVDHGVAEIYPIRSKKENQKKKPRVR